MSRGHRDGGAGLSANRLRPVKLGHICHGERAQRAIARFRHVASIQVRQREILAVRQILLTTYPQTTQKRVAQVNGWRLGPVACIYRGEDAQGAAKLAAQILDELATQLPA